MLHTFTIGFEKILKDLSFTSRGFAWLIDTLCTLAGLKVSAMAAYTVVTKVLGTEEFPQHNITDLNSSITFIVLLSQKKPLRWKEINTHAYTCN